MRHGTPRTTSSSATRQTVERRWHNRSVGSLCSTILSPLSPLSDLRVRTHYILYCCVLSRTAVFSHLTPFKPITRIRRPNNVTRILSPRQVSFSVQIYSGPSASVTGREQTEAHQTISSLSALQKEGPLQRIYYIIIGVIKNTCSDGSHRAAPGGWCSAPVIIYTTIPTRICIYYCVINSLPGKRCDAEKLCVATAALLYTVYHRRRRRRRRNRH